MLNLIPPTGALPGTSLATATRLADRCRAQSTEDQKKEWGQYFTSSAVATFMSSIVTVPAKARSLRVLDPGAGTGILGVALCERLVRAGRSVHLVAVENEPEASRHLTEVLDAVASDLGSKLSFEVRRADFLDLAEPRLGVEPLAPFDMAIGNPPYFKMSPGDTRGGDAPNIYARFMEVAGRLLVPGGQMCFIVPRSFAAGYYFQRFRKRFHAFMHLTRAHVFESRRDAFKADGVLQENIIVLYRRDAAESADVILSSSAGEHDLSRMVAHSIPRSRTLLPDDRNALLHLPTSSEDLRVMDIVRSFGHVLASHGMDVSTGPVVPFRSTEDLVPVGFVGETYPMLWMQHVRATGVRWPLGSTFRKPEHIRREAPEKLLVANSTYVLLRRFSSKEEPRRLTAALLAEGELPGAHIGLENHLNFIHRPGGKLTPEEAAALTTLLNSSLLDAYFRISSGNTQVSATELRAIPIPGPETLMRIAQRATERPRSTPDEILRDALGTN